jgi:hypothetical protein
MRITSAEPGIDLCFDNNCNTTMCIAGDIDYFGEWRYKGFNPFENLSFDRVIWLFGFIFSFVIFFVFIGFLIVLIFGLLTSGWTKNIK